MRKAAFVTGIICAVFSAIAAVLKLTGIPGGSFLFLIFSGAFAGVVMPMHYFAQSRSAQPGIKRIADFLGIITGMHLIIGLLFLVLNWNGYLLFFVQGGFLALFFIVTLLMAANKPGVTVRWFSPFTALYLAVIIALAIGCWKREKQNTDISAQQTALVEEILKCKAAQHTADSLIAAFMSDTSTSALDSAAANMLFINAYALIEQIEDYKCEIVKRSGDISTCINEQGGYAVSRPDDHDVPTMMMVGSDPQNPTGDALTLYHQVAGYRKNQLHPEVSFGVPVVDQPEYAEQWAKDNFYHATVLETLTRLTQIQTKICESVSESIDKKLFR